MALDRSQPGKVLPSKAPMLNMCLFPERLCKNALRRSICSTTATYGNMLFPNAAVEILIPPPCLYGCQMHLHFATAPNQNCLCIPMRLKPSLHRSMSMNILSFFFCSLSWRREGFRPWCLWKSNWGINLRHQQEQQFGHSCCQDAEGWGLSLCMRSVS